MQGKRIQKRLWAGILAMMLLFTSVNLPAKAGVAASIGKYAMTIAGRAFAGAIVDVADDLDPNSPIHTLNYLLLGITQDKAAIMCKELLNDVEELNKEMNKSKDYLSDMMNDLEEKESKDALTAYINNMTDASGEVTTSLWLEYETYLIEAAEYADDPTQTNHDNMVNAGNILFDHMDQLYRQLSQVSRTFNLSFNFKVNYEDAKAFRKANGGYLRGGQWNDLLVEVCII